MERINIVFSSDDRYVQHLGVTIVSILKNSSFKEQLDFYVIDGGIADDDKKLLNKCILEYGCCIRFLRLNPERYEEFEAQSYQGMATYFRIFVSELLDESIEKILYLDCDIIVKTDIKELWDTDVSNHFFAAVYDSGINYHMTGLELKHGLGMPGNAVYFNAGIMVINLRKWRECGIPEKIKDFLINNKDKITFADQDGINGVLYNQWLQLPLAWNQQAFLFEMKKRKYLLTEESKYALENPKIIHYSLKSKPWHFMNAHPMKNEYYKYLAMTPWKDYKPTGKSIWRAVLRCFLKTSAGQRAQKYYEEIIWNFSMDKEKLSPRLGNSIVFKGLYFVFFPLGRGYLRRISWMVAWSYYIGYNELNSKGVKRVRVLIWHILLFPSRFLVPKAVRAYQMEYNTRPRYACPCCGKEILYKEPQESDELCSNCLWRNDPKQFMDPENEDGFNGISLKAARTNYKKYRYCDVKFIRNAKYDT